jgi:N-methylhydantoinase A/oxoprolinase/acetone carboxylase beta subunit
VGPADPSSARKADRPVYFGERFVATGVYERDRLGPGARVDGPAIIESPLTTIVIPPGRRADVDGYRDLVIRSG